MSLERPSATELGSATAEFYSTATHSDPICGSQTFRITASFPSQTQRVFRCQHRHIGPRRCTAALISKSKGLAASSSLHQSTSFIEVRRADGVNPDTASGHLRCLVYISIRSDPPRAPETPTSCVVRPICPSGAWITCYVALFGRRSYCRHSIVPLIDRQHLKIPSSGHGIG